MACRIAIAVVGFRRARLACAADVLIKRAAPMT